jgi:hypothetical protein
MLTDRELRRPPLREHMLAGHVRFAAMPPEEEVLVSSAALDGGDEGGAVERK